MEFPSMEITQHLTRGGLGQRAQADPARER